MPITLPPITRRQFIAGTLGAGAASLLWPGDLRSAELKTDPHRLALLSDTHIAADPTAHERDVVMYDHLKQVCAEVLGLEARPAAVLINGDCAYHKGFVEDYQTLVELLRPVRERGLPLHLTMGNHDERSHLWQTIEHVEEHVDPLPQRQTVVLEMPRANLFMLDSLDQTDHTPGVLGEQQIHWLGAELDARKTKPAIVMVHHQPDQRPKASGLTDTQALLDAILPRRQVKALFYGHTHHWEVTQRNEMHCINLPAVAYVFTKGDPSGWVDAHIKEDGMSLELRCTDTAHPKHGQKVDLTWRA